VTPLRDLDPERSGGKAAGLKWLVDHGYAVPPTWVLTDPVTDAGRVQPALASVVDDDRSYAVRSSANVEDGGDTSYAGQFLSVLEVHGVDGVLDAVQRVAASARSAGVEAYRTSIADERPVEMAVLVQEMVTPVWSGVGFSRNPITGLGETVVEAVAGSGEALMAGGVTPERWVRRWGDYIEQPDAAIVDERVIAEVIATTQRIAREYGAPVDVEWVHDGSKLWWVQVRAISGLDDITIYSRRISKEVMPGIIKPLVWSINVPMVNQAWVALFREALGEVAVEPEDLAKSFGYRSYFNMSAIGEIFSVMGMPRESLELLLGLPAGSEQPRFKPSATTFRKTPRMLGMALRKIRYDKEVERQLASLDSEFARFAGRDVSSLSDRELLADVEALRRIGVRAASVNIVTPLLANIYSALLRRQLGKGGVDLHSVDLLEGMDELGDFDPNPHLDELARKIRRLDRATREAVMRDGSTVLPDDLKHELDEFLEKFGHFSDSGNDFSIPPWREQPDTVVKMAAMRRDRDRASQRSSWDEARSAIPAWRRPLAGAMRKRARRFVHHREAVSSTYTYGYGLFRNYFLEIGRRLVERDVLAEANDVMYLDLVAVREALSPGGGAGAAQAVAACKAEIDSVRDIELPDVIYGDDFIPRPADDLAATSWHGTPTARGHHRGPVCVVRGLADFEKVREGDVLAIPYSDVGWTPLFAKAGAVVAESGGLLSHSSIVAREYGIPCVVSVDGAMRMPEGEIVTVDGYRGVVVLEAEGS
jgi:pyruvate,water dikinase